MNNKRIHPILYRIGLYFKSMTWASSQSAGTSTGQWKYIYTKACSMGNTVQPENYDIVEIMESISFAAGLNDLNALFKPI